MMAFLISPRGIQLLGIVGPAIVVFGALVAALAYRGKEGEPYSPFNHYISELGEVGVSHLSFVFNLSLILSGLFLIPACIGLGLMLPGVLAKIGMAAGIIFLIFLALVGIIPMNKAEPHGRIAMTNIRAGLVMVLLFSLAIALQSAPTPVLPRLFALGGLPAILSTAGFLILARRAGKKEEDPLESEEAARPKVSALPTLEWLIFLTIVLWFALISWGL